MRLVSQLTFLYDLIVDFAIIQILYHLSLYLPLLLKILHFSCLEKLELVLKFFFFNISNASFASFVHTNGPIFILVKSLIFTA